MINTWLILGLSIMAETFATSMIKSADGFTRLIPSAIVVSGYVFAFYGISQVVKTMNVGIAYAIWGGCGIVLVSALSYFIHGQKLDSAAMTGR
ncbi:DMT family transporter [Pantoea piersonii]|uniref:DMT family transporter n=1 Tax=Pantoea piersonii TaxID=2364647 RepID=UPI002896A24F|nr:SMR family transporter [Pantoea piersonii]MDU6441828.1 SMR family transporter [Pantoea sp.]